MPTKKLNSKSNVIKTRKIKTVSAKVAAKKSLTTKSLVPSVVARKIVNKAKTESKATGLSVKVFDTTGKAAGTAILPKEIFGQKPNTKLLSQAMHIYFTNSKTHYANTKTRSEVRGGGKKPWKQKGTGNARAGSTRSPLWVGGGRTFGPRYRDVKLTLPAKMRKQALISALSQKAQNGEIKVITSLEKIQPKTKIMASLLAKIEAKSPTLLVSGKDNKNIKLAVRNIQKTSIDTSNNLNAYEILKNRDILISKEALGEFA